MWKLMEVESHTGISLTESLAMDPAASVSGLYFTHPSSSYFAVGKITEEQVRYFECHKNSFVNNSSYVLAIEQ